MCPSLLILWFRTFGTILIPFVAIPGMMTLTGIDRIVRTTTSRYMAITDGIQICFVTSIATPNYSLGGSSGGALSGDGALSGGSNYHSGAAS